MGSRRVDELFGKVPDTSHVRWIVGLLVVAVPLSLAGILTCTSGPGSLLALAAWQLANRDMARVEAGELAADHLPVLARARTVSMGSMALCMLGFVIQLYLLSTGSYGELLRGLD